MLDRRGFLAATVLAPLAVLVAPLIGDLDGWKLDPGHRQALDAARALDRKDAFAVEIDRQLKLSMERMRRETFRMMMGG